MLSNNDVQLFYKLLDSLSSSLKELAIKYELIVRASDGNTKSISDITKDMSGVSRDVEKVGIAVREARDKSASDVKVMEDAIAKCIEDIKEINDILSRASEAHAVSAGIASEMNQLLKHVDDHLDSSSGDVVRIKGKVDELITATSGLKTMEQNVKDMRDEMKPVVTVAKTIEGPLDTFKQHLKKPASVLLVIYVLLSSYIAFTKATAWMWNNVQEIRQQATAPAAPAQTSKVSTNGGKH